MRRLRPGRADDRNVHDVVGAAATAEIVQHPVEPLEQWPERLCAAEAFGDLVGEVPLSRSGNTNTFARPATGDPGALVSATAGTKAASNCNSPSTARSGARWRTRAVASTTLSTRGWVALPFDENDNIATAGSSLANWAKSLLTRSPRRRVGQQSGRAARRSRHRRAGGRRTARKRTNCSRPRHRAQRRAPGYQHG